MKHFQALIKISLYFLLSARIYLTVEGATPSKRQTLVHCDHDYIIKQYFNSCKSYYGKRSNFYHPPIIKSDFPPYNRYQNNEDDSYEREAEMIVGLRSPDRGSYKYLPGQPLTRPKTGMNFNSNNYNARKRRYEYYNDEDNFFYYKTLFTEKNEKNRKVRNAAIKFLEKCCSTGCNENDFHTYCSITQ